MSNHVNSNVNKNKANNKSLLNVNENTIKKSNKINKFSDKISIIHWNSNSINNKIDEFKDFCARYKPHIISLNETKLSELKANYILQVDNYTTIHRARSHDTNGGGGVALIIRNLKLEFKLRNMCN